MMESEVREMAEKIGDVINRIMHNALERSAQLNKDLEQLISRHDLDKYECTVSVREIKDGMTLAFRTFKRKPGEGQD